MNEIFIKFWKNGKDELYGEALLEFLTPHAKNCRLQDWKDYCTNLPQADSDRRKRMRAIRAFIKFAKTKGVDLPATFD